MSLVKKVMETVVQFMPAKKPDPLMDRQGYMGRPMNRVDGSVKVKGEATFTADYQIENLAYASLVYSTIAKGRVTKIDTSAADTTPGFIAVMTHENAPRMKAPPLFSLTDATQGYAGSDLPVMQDAEVHWNGQPVAVAIAATQDQADAAAALVRVEYEEEPAETDFAKLIPDAVEPAQVLGEDPTIKIGDAVGNLNHAEVKVDHVYHTPRNTQNPLETNTTIAIWQDDEHLTMFDSTQFVSGTKDVMLRMFQLKAGNVRVISPFVGGGFGSKLSMWNNTPLCAAAAKLVKRPVKLRLSRKGVYFVVGGRTVSEQRVAIGATKEGKFTALIHTGTTATTTHARYAEQFSFPARHLYDAGSFFIQQKVVNMNMVANTWMRAPGESIGTFALESAIDELAEKLGIDPIALRRLNEPEKDPTKKIGFSSRHLLEAFEKGAEKFGWKHQAPGTQRDGKWLIGQGVAAATYPGFRFPATARVRLTADGGVLVRAAANEMGMGTATVQIQHAAERLGVAIDRVSFEYGDSDLPQSPNAGGSGQTVSVGAAVAAAIGKAQKELLALARKQGDSPLAKLKFEEVEARDGGLFSKEDRSRGETYVAILERAGIDKLEVEESTGMPFEILQYSIHSYGAHFCEVRVNSETGEVRIARWVGSFDCGRILNAKTAASQFRGGIIMGIGMALMEETVYDERTGRIANPSLADYHFPAHLDIPHIDVIHTDIPDPRFPMGARGVGEIGITGAAAAVANAVYNATGKRIRDLPITLDKLL